MAHIPTELTQVTNIITLIFCMLYDNCVCIDVININDKSSRSGNNDIQERQLSRHAAVVTNHNYAVDDVTKDCEQFPNLERDFGLISSEECSIGSCSNASSSSQHCCCCCWKIVNNHTSNKSNNNKLSPNQSHDGIRKPKKKLTMKKHTNDHYHYDDDVVVDDGNDDGKNCDDNDYENDDAGEWSDKQSESSSLPDIIPKTAVNSVAADSERGCNLKKRNLNKKNEGASKRHISNNTGQANSANNNKTTVKRNAQGALVAVI
ncbi:hypothetical protein HELRODRAFT_177805 [Helobdella robusta]|uniref:Uncharacterized protein n=1 Tax=Helobdella robusta TaxID=6412 RepID=T1FCA7_HELRO|nr:hypothetical protein HELRODRAFT_177805 [Helobdella robusta]ESN97745.1 hypothetical protein HELRODRAFT_177805 [Helobdella robusta]